jgi:hypothetical protein
VTSARKLHGCMVDVLGIVAAVLIVTLVLGLLLAASAPAPMIAPNFSFTYRSTLLPQHIANVYVRTQQDGSLWPAPRDGVRPVLIGPLEGGGFAAGSGIPWNGLTVGGADLASRLYERGCVIVCMGYTVDTPSLTGSGRYGTQYQAEDDIALVLAELETYLDRIPDMDLRDIGLHGRSAGSSVALHWATRQRAAWVVTYQTVATFASYPPATTLRHFLDGSGQPATTLGQVPLATLHEQGALQRIARGELRCPIFAQSGSTQTYFGSLAWQDFVHVTGPALHPVEQVLALKVAAAQSPHMALSAFVTAPVSARVEQAAYDWACGIWGI